jgi:hypothetical protein
MITYLLFVDVSAGSDDGGMFLLESSVYSPLDEFHSLADGQPPPDTEMLNDANASE